VSNFDICKDKWFFEPKSEQDRDVFLEWAYEQGMVWRGDSPRSNNYLSVECVIGGNNAKQGNLGWCDSDTGDGRDFYESRGHLEIFPIFKLCVDKLLLPVVESPQQKKIRELEETIAKAQEQIESLKKVI